MHDMVFFLNLHVAGLANTPDIVHSRSLGEHLALHVTMTYVRFANA